MIFDGYDMGSLLTVEDITRPLMPQVSADIDEVPARDGGMVRSVSLGVREIEVRVRMFAPFVGYRDQAGGLERLRREIAGRLWRTEPKKLVLHDAPDLYDMALLTDFGQLERLSHTQSTTLTFTCTEGASFGRTRRKRIRGSGVIDVGGTYCTAPIITVSTPDATTAVIWDGRTTRVEGQHPGEGPFVFDGTEDGCCTREGQYVPVDVHDDFPVFAPGHHVVQVPEGAEALVEWTERWL